MATQKRTIKNKINVFIYNNIIHLLSKKKQYQLEYQRQQGKKLNLDNPQRFTEKLFWIMRYNELYNKELIQKVYDKHTVREYIKEKGLEKILVKQIAHYKSCDEINIDELPMQFALKMTQSCGENIICTDKNKLNIQEVKAKIHRWQSKDKTKNNLQGYYFTSDESIVCEELLTDANGNIPEDFRVCCCNGEPAFIYCDLDSLDENNDKRKVYYRECFDLNWNYLPVDFGYRPRKDKNVAYTQKPKNLKEILEISQVLAKDFIFVRIDFYLVNNRIYFGELTPIPGMGGGFCPDKYDFYFGKMLKLPNKKIF